VRIVENSPVAHRIARLSGQVHLEQNRPLGMTIFHTIHFTQALDPDYADMPWLIHELTHVWQYLQRGPRYLTDALRAQAQLGEEAYDIEQGLTEGWPWSKFNAEQQADIARDYYRALVSGQNLITFSPYINILRYGEDGRLHRV
jgi:hypothetical protein